MYSLITSYKFIAGTNAHELQKQVNSLIGCGYVPLGAPISMCGQLGLSLGLLPPTARRKSFQQIKSFHVITVKISGPKSPDLLMSKVNAMLGNYIPIGGVTFDMANGCFVQSMGQYQ